MLTIADLSKSYGTRTLFHDVSLFVARTDRFGLVGANSVGKTTLFNLILGEESPDGGTITWERGANFGYLPQESAPAGDDTVLDLACAITPEFAELRIQLHALEHGGSAPCMADELEAHHRFDELGGYEVETRAKKILAGLGFREHDFHQPARTFSGGWVMRAHLARLLTAEPALLLLDEPTNHLDLHALLWFQDYLTRYPGGLVVISHDRAFLNALCNGILEIRATTLNRYTGNYDDYLRQRDERHAQQLALYKNQQREIAHLQKFVDRFGAKATLASRAKSKEKQIERLQENAVDAPEEDLKRINFRFPQPPRSGLRVVTLEHVRQAYGDHVVYRDLNFSAERHQRIVLVGPNGAGKSTLLKILADVVPIQRGTRELGANVTAGYFAQTRTDTLRPDATVLDNVMDLRTAQNDLTEQQARTILGAFLFRKDDVFKKVAVLSGGEKSRLALARLLVNPPNLLLMDEPTTHLDIASIDALVHALKQFQGTLIFISHDVYFIREVAQHVLHIDAGHLTPYAGDYDYYLEKSKATDARAATVAAGFTDARPVQLKTQNSEPKTGATARSGPKTKEQKRAEAEARAARSAPLKAAKARVQQLEAEIAKLETQQSELTAALEAPETYNEPGKAQHLNRELSATVARLAAATEEWEAAANKLAKLENP
ncbi:MAG TPA: ABC-F family ATP-binding cassette domain-containing protein [Opitutus sp.]|nr:ABC-F family ATP-binding cassette domain-containing protein [Opitutus sp.]